jgi:hypothetical protein
MKRNFLAAAVALSPLLVAIAHPAAAQVSITSSTSTPIATATASSGSPANVDIAAGGSINVTTPGYAVEINSNNTVTNEGAIGFSNVNGATGVLIQGGNTGQFTTTGTIQVSESYTASADTNNDGLDNGAWAQGTDRVGIWVKGASPFTGAVTPTGAITVQGNDSEGILIQTPITGALVMQTVTSDTSTATTAVGSITITGDKTVGLDVTPTGGVGGDVRIAGVTARGVGAQAVVLDGNVGGFVNISGAVSASGYRTIARSTNPSASVLYQAQEMEQGGAAVTVGGNIGGGLIVSAPPPVLTTSTTNVDPYGTGIPESLEGTGSVTSYGSAPAIQVGAVASVEGGPAPSITIGRYETGTLASILGYGMVVQGTVTANGLFDQLTSPNLPNAVSATAIQIGGRILITPEMFTTTGTVTTVTPAVYARSGSVTIDGGLYNSGGILANAYQANATAIDVGKGGRVPRIVNEGNITALSTQVNSATTVTPASGSTPAVPAPVAVNVTAIEIDKGGSVTSITNNSGILAEITGTGGVGAKAVTAILDTSGSLSSIDNTGSIAAELNQTLASAPISGPTVAINMSAGKGAQTITQTVSQNSAVSTPYSTTNTYVIGNIVSYNGLLYSAIAAAGNGNDPVDYPGLWREIGALSPSINGDIKFGSGPDKLDVEGGTVMTSNSGAGVIAMGGATNTLIVNNGATVTGAITERAGGLFNINVESGTLSDTSAVAANATSVNVGATGVLLISADPARGTNTHFLASGASTFASGAEIGLTLQSVQFAQSKTYIVLQTIGQGTLTTGTFGTPTLNNAPYLYTATPTLSASAGQIDLTVTRRTAAQLGFDQAEGSALNAVLTALPNNPAIEAAVLAQTTQAGLKSVYDQMLPDQGLGVFDTIDAAAQRISAMTGTTPDAGSRLAGTSLWLQEVNERVDRSDDATSLGSSTKLLGLVGGFEHMGPAGGAVGLTLAYMNVQEDDSDAALGEHVVASILEAGAYYRRSIGAFSFSARGAGGYAWFSGDRLFVAPGAYAQALSDWGGVFVDGHAQVTYEVGFGRFYARPEISLDYTHLQENARNETGGGAGFDLNVDSSSSSRLSGQAIVVLGTQIGKADWLRPEIRFGYREILSSQLGDTVASFSGGDPFTLAAPNDSGGWATIGFSIKGGTPYSYVALEGDADFRAGEQRFDVRVAGRSMF